MRPYARASAAANRVCMPGRSCPETSRTSYPCPSSRLRTSAGSLRASTVGPEILYPFRCRTGSTAPSRAGLRKDTPFHDPSSGAVSASPSPTTATASRSGLSITAPNAWTRTYPSSPPSWIEPGVVTDAWLGMPPGVENCRNSRRIPTASCATPGYTSL